MDKGKSQSGQVEGRSPTTDLNVPPLLASKRIDVDISESSAIEKKRLNSGTSRVDRIHTPTRISMLVRAGLSKNEDGLRKNSEAAVLL